VIPNDPNIQRVELVASALGELRDQLVLVGGCAVSLLIDSATAPPPRVTYDVDLIAEVAALRDCHALEKAFAQRGFTRDMSLEAPICGMPINLILRPVQSLMCSSGPKPGSKDLTRTTRGLHPGDIAAALLSVDEPPGPSLKCRAPRGAYAQFASNPAA
jgi:hypothetical protein